MVVKYWQVQPVISVFVEPVTVAVSVTDCDTITTVVGLVTVTVTTFVFPPPPQPASTAAANMARSGHSDALVSRNFVNTITPKFSPASAAADTRDF